MHLSPVLSQLPGKVVSQVRRFNWTKQKIQINEFTHNFLKNISWKSPRVIGGLSIFVLLIGGSTYYLSTTTSAVAVMINGQQIGFVRNITTGKTLVETILKGQGKPFGLIAKTSDQITYKSMRVNPEVYLKSSLQEKDLAQKLSTFLDGYELEVNGSVVAVLPNQQAVDKVLKEYQDYYVKPSSGNKVVSVNFVEKVNTKKVEVQPDQMEQPDQAFQMLLNGESSTTNYTVKPNDSWWLIARKNNMLTDEVLAGNPGATENTPLQPGQIVKLVNVVPYITVVSKGTYTGTEVVPYDVVTKTDYNLGQGGSKVVTKGSDGSKLVTYSYVQQNGIDINQDVVKEQVIKPPVTEVIAAGSSSRFSNRSYLVSRGGGGSLSLVNHALSFVGASYVFGGTTPGGFDCSGFTKYIYSGSGISLPRTSYAQFASGAAVSMDELKPGDLVFFTTYSRGASHVGIYIGGGRFVHAANPSSGVEVSSLNNSYYSSHYLGARRY